MTTAGQEYDHREFGEPETGGPPAFVWRLRDCAIVWANTAGLALWGADSSGELAKRPLDRAMPAVARLQRLLLVLAPGASDRQDFVFWLPKGSRSLPCACRRIRYQGEDAILLQLAPPEALTKGGGFAGVREAPQTAGLNGHGTPLVPAIAKTGPATTFPAAPPLAPQDAATLAEIARLIRQRSDGTPAQGSGAQSEEPSKPPASLAAPELAAGSAELLGRLSHELRTPLNAIIGYAELLQSEQQGPLGSPKYRAYTADMLEAARHCLSLVNDLFDMTKLAAGEQKLEFSDVDINDAVRSSLGIMAPIASKAGVSLAEDLAPGLPLAILDRRGLRQILLNLVANAIKFTPKGGQVTVSSRYVTGVGLDVAVADTGLGMTVGDLESARGRGQDNAATAVSGAGLGLPISRALATASGAALTVESTPGEGTRATLFLPMTRLHLR